MSAGGRRPGRAMARAVLGGGALASLLPLPLAGYLALVTAAAWRAKRAGHHRTTPRPEPSTRFVVLIPAHDEERLIGDALESLRRLDYPAELVQVHVVADHCSDGTVAIARAAGATVHEHVDPLPRGKGPALQWALGRLSGDGIDAVVVLDADSVVDRGFLAALDARLAEGGLVFQAHYAVRDASSTSQTELRSLALALRHYVRPLGRAALGASCGLYGNGMAFARPVLERVAWSDHLTEDLELQAELLLAGIPVGFVPDARLHAEMPATLAQAQSQNERWERGRIELVARFVPRLLRAASGAGSRRERLALVDTAVDLAVPPLSVLAAACTAATGWCLVTAGVLRSRSSRQALAAAVLMTAAVGFHVVAGVRIAETGPIGVRQLVAAPRAVVWKVELWVRMLLRRQGTGWVRTARNEALPPGTDD